MTFNHHPFSNVMLPLRVSSSCIPANLAIRCCTNIGNIYLIWDVIRDVWLCQRMNYPYQQQKQTRQCTWSLNIHPHFELCCVIWGNIYTYAYVCQFVSTLFSFIWGLLLVAYWKCFLFFIYLNFVLFIYYYCYYYYYKLAFEIMQH